LVDLGHLSELLSSLRVGGSEEGSAGQTQASDETLVLHVVYLVYEAGNDVEPNPAEDGGEEQEEDAQALVDLGHLSELLSSLRVGGSKESSGGKTHTSDESLVLLGHIIQLGAGGAKDVERNPAQDGAEEQEEDTQAVVHLRHLGQLAQGKARVCGGEGRQGTEGSQVLDRHLAHLLLGLGQGLGHADARGHAEGGAETRGGNRRTRANGAGGRRPPKSRASGDARARECDRHG